MRSGSDRLRPAGRLLAAAGATAMLLGSVRSGVTGERFRNSSLTPAERAADLLPRLTLSEKIAQMDMLNGRALAGTASLDTVLAAKLVGNDGVGAIHDLYPASPALVNELQAFVMNRSRLGIPVLVVEETLHGCVQPGSTTFPVPLALAATWDPELVEAVGRAIGGEARARGTTVGLSPVLGIARDPRWGRVEETFGEDTWLVGRLGRAMVEGMQQGGDLALPEAVAAVVKHFAVHSVPEGGTNSSPANVGRREALQFFLEPFRAAVVNGGARGVMTAYSEWNGIPCTGDPWLLGDLLRRRWRFDGFTLADMGAIRMLATCHFTTDSPAASLRQGVTAGVDMQFYDFPSRDFRSLVADLVKEGELDKAAVDRAAGDVLRLKFALGLFEVPFVDTDQASRSGHGAAHRELALRAARESVVLLQNDGVLPLGPKVRRIAVVGPAADSAYPGGYAPRDAAAATLLDGLREIAGSDVEIRSVKGVSFINGGVPVPGDLLRAADGTTPGVDAAYFANDTLAGEPVLRRVDQAINFDWDTHAPAASVPPDNFSVRWDGWLGPDRDVRGWIGVSSDDGCRLWLEDRLVIDSWEAGVTNRRHPVDLHAGQWYKVRLEYRENLGGASASLRWSEGADDLAAVARLAAWADVVIAAVGEDGMLVGENHDRLSLELSGRQSDLVAQAAAVGKPLVLVLISGRPVALADESPLASAVVCGFFGGEGAGTALAEVLLGRVNPSGRLPITFPRSTGQLPCFYNQKPSRVMRYADGEAKPLYPFGHGLSYSAFAYRGLRLERETLTPDDTLRFALEVENTSGRAGTAVIEVYVNDRISTVTTPVRELKAVRRVRLAAGERRTVRCTIPIDDLSLVNARLEREVEPGEFELMVGESADDIRLRSTFRVDPSRK